MSKSIAIMQPYLFPYIGYFQLIDAVDKFAFYDDVNFIKKGWINRNRLLVNGADYTFTVPLKKISQNNLIFESYIKHDVYEDWKNKFLHTIELNYKKAPEFNKVYCMLDFFFSKEYNSVSEIAIQSVILISNYLGIDTEFVISSQSYHNRGLERQERLIDICKIEKIDRYVNALGGQELYKKEDFLKDGIQLEFIKSLPIEYKQFSNDFKPWLSIIDVLMFNSVENISSMLKRYELI